VFGCDTLLRIPIQIHAAKPSVVSSFLRERITHTSLDLQAKVACQLWALGASKFQNYFFGTSQADWRIIEQMFEHLNTLNDKQKQLKECDNVGNFNQGTT